MSTLNMNEITEGIRQLCIKSRTATVAGVTLEGAVKLQGLFDEIDNLCMRAEGLMEHPARYSLANGMTNDKPAHLHTEVRLRRRSDRMEQSFGHRTREGEQGEAHPEQPTVQESNGG